MSGPTLETDRLILRPPAAGDLDAWAELLADATAAEFIGGARSRHEAWRNLSLTAGAWLINGFSFFSIVEKSSGRWIGRAGPWQPEGWPGPEVGWALQRSFWGKGYATEAATRCMDWAFDELGWDAVIHVIDPKNAASIAVAKRLGSTLIGPTRLPHLSEDAALDLYGQSRQSWRMRSVKSGANHE